MVDMGNKANESVTDLPKSCGCATRVATIWTSANARVILGGEVCSDAEDAS